MIIYKAILYLKYIEQITVYISLWIFHAFSRDVIWTSYFRLAAKTGHLQGSVPLNFG